MNAYWLACLLLGPTGSPPDEAKLPNRIEQRPAQPTRSLNAWVQQLKDKDPDTRRRAAEALGNLGTDAGVASASLVEALQDPSSMVRAEAAHALGQCLPLTQPTINALVRALKDEDPRVRMWVAHALGEF